MYTDRNGKNWYKVQLHMHTNISDGRCSPEEAAEIYKNAGFDAIALTDHWNYHADGEIGGVKIISGCEYNIGASDTSVDVMHIVGVGMKYDPKIDRQSSRQQVIDAIKGAGGFVILAHPAWSLNTPEHTKELSGIDAIEIYNTVSVVGQSRRPYSGYFVDLLANEGVTYPLIATDDTHYYQGKDETISYIMVNAESCSNEDIFTAIRNLKFYATQGPHLTVKREGNRIIADSSKCNEIVFLSNLAWVPDRVHEGKGITHAEYKIKPDDKWIRVEAMDANGKFAWSNIFKI